MVLVDSTKHGLRLVTLVIGVTQIEGDYWLVKETLVNHTVERRHDLVDTDGIIAETHDPIETTKCEGKARLFGGFGKVLVFNLDIPDLDCVLRDEAAQTAGAITDLEV